MKPDEDTMQLYYMALLGNVDESILKLNDILEHGFNVYEIDLSDIKDKHITEIDMSDIKDEKCKTIQKLERLEDYSGLQDKLTNNYHCMSDNKIYCILNVFDVPEKKGYVQEELIGDEEYKIIFRYVNTFFRKVRLFKEENLLLSVQYFYSQEENGMTHLLYRFGSLQSELADQFVLTESELIQLKEVMNDFQYPLKFNNSFTELAFENFELSYHTHVYKLKLLLLMMSLEVLFKSGRKGVSHTVAKNVASFLGEDSNQFGYIYCRLRELYKIRSDIVHNGDSDLEFNDMTKLVKEIRQYVRESIVKIDAIGKDKEEFIEYLNKKSITNNCIDH